MREKQNAYNIVASELRERILNKQWLPHQQLPTEHELVEEFSVSRITIRRALEILEEEHLIHRKQGKGSYVSPAPARRIPLLIDYARSIRTHAPRLHRELRIWKWVNPPDQIAEELNIAAENLVLHCQRIDILEGIPVAFDRAYIPKAFAENISEQDMAEVNFNDVWQSRANFTILRCKQVVDSVLADAQISELLNIQEHSAVLKGTELYFTHKNRPTGIFINFYHPDYISLVSNFNWSAKQEIQEDR